MSDSNSRLVYSTETGRIDEPKAAPVRPKGDGVVRIQLMRRAINALYLVR